MKKNLSKLALATIALFLSFVIVLKDSPYFSTLGTLFLLSATGILLFLIYKFLKKKWIVIISVFLLILLIICFFQHTVFSTEFTLNTHVYNETIIYWDAIFIGFFYSLQFAYWLILGNDFILEIENKEKFSLAFSSLYIIIEVAFIFNQYTDMKMPGFHVPYYALFSLFYICYILYRVLNANISKVKI